ERDGKDGIAESLEPCVGVRVCHVVVVSVYGVGDPEPCDRRNEAMNRSFVSGSQTYYLTHQRASSLSSRATAKPVEQKFTCAVFLLHRHGVPHGVPGATLTRLPNRPSFSPFGPAVKSMALASPPLRPFPTLSAHNPSITICCPSVLTTLPRNSPVAGSNALMRPSPKLPINTAPANRPKLGGACTSPHGEFRCPCWANRPRSVPSRLNVSTTPCA